MLKWPRRVSHVPSVNCVDTEWTLTLTRHLILQVARGDDGR